MAWGFAILVPAGFLVFGFARMAHTLDAATSLRPTTVTPTLARALGPDHLAATDLRLPGGRRIHELVLGPFGILVLGDVPPAAVSRHVGSRWEIRGARGRWVPIEAPLDRASRDAERVRGWLATHDRDFLVRVYAAVVTDDPRVDRTPTCAVVKPGDLAGWLEALPVQRGLKPSGASRSQSVARSASAADQRCRDRGSPSSAGSPRRVRRLAGVVSTTGPLGAADEVRLGQVAMLDLANSACRSSTAP